jgi:hypothetical protein
LTIKIFSIENRISGNIAGFQEILQDFRKFCWIAGNIAGF